MRSIRDSWLAFVIVLMPACVSAQPMPTQIPSVATQGNHRQVGTPPTPPPSSIDADIAQCSEGHPASELERAKTIAACTHVIDVARAKFGSGPEFGRLVWFAFFIRGVNYNVSNNIAAGIVDLTEAIRLRPDFALAFTMRGLGYVKSGPPSWAIQDLDRAIDLAKRVPSKEFNTDEAWAGALLGRSIAYAKIGDYGKAVQDYEDLRERFPTIPTIPLDPALDKAIKAIQAQRDAGSSSQSSDQTFVCNLENPRDLMIVTVIPRLQTMRFELRTAATNSVCTMEFRDGRFSNTLVSSSGFGLGCSLVGTVNGAVQQRVTITRAEAQASGTQNGVVGLNIKLDLGTGILRSTAGAVLACHRARG